MRLATAGGSHLTYCTNVHPGESWREAFANLREYLPPIKRLVSPGGAFGVGLRLSGRAAAELEQPGEIDRFRSWLDEQGLYVFTINGFPHGAFHGTRVKERVYLPDWLEGERQRYADALARILAGLLPPEVEGSVSTVPGAFRERVRSPEHAALIADHLLQHAATLHRIAQQTGKSIAVALEPEPCCYLETTAQTIAFFEERLFSRPALDRFAALAGLSPSAAEEVLRRHLGVCFDACHLAVEFEDLPGSIRALRSAGIRIAKVQLSAGLRAALGPQTDEIASALRRFADPVYLHQVIERRGGGLRRFLDLDEALGSLDRADSAAREWRIHFHVPVFQRRYGLLENTQGDLEALLQLLRREPCSGHLEVETYTWDVLPEEHRREGLVASIARELQWVLERMRP
jgi:sugar phosphate isomerase/epimerase